MSLGLRLPRKMYLCRSSSNFPRLPSFLEMLQNPHVLLTFDKVHNPVCLPGKTALQRPKVARGPAGSAQAALASLLFDPLEPQIIGKTQCFATFLPFRAPGSSFFGDFLFLIFFFFLLFSSLTLPIYLCFSSVHIVGSLTSKLPSIRITGATFGLKATLDDASLDIKFRIQPRCWHVRLLLNWKQHKPAFPEMTMESNMMESRVLQTIDRGSIAAPWSWKLGVPAMGWVPSLYIYICIYCMDCFK